MGEIFGFVEVRKSRAVLVQIHRGDVCEQRFNPMRRLVEGHAFRKMSEERLSLSCFVHRNAPFWRTVNERINGLGC